MTRASTPPAAPAWKSGLVGFGAGFAVGAAVGAALGFVMVCIWLYQTIRGGHDIVMQMYWLAPIMIVLGLFGGAVAGGVYGALIGALTSVGASLTRGGTGRWALPRTWYLARLAIVLVTIVLCIVAAIVRPKFLHF